MPGKDRLKQRMIRDLVAENLDTIRGTLPSGLRRRRRPGRAWLLGALGATILVAFSGTIRSTAVHAWGRRPPAAARAVAPAAAATRELPAPQRIDPSLFQLAVRKIVVDPGHGGSDPGALTAEGLEEKTLTLDIAQRLRALLKDAPFSLVLTRSRDESVSLERRVEFANAENADLFLSIHINSMPMPGRVGIETFYLGETSDPRTARFARAENSGSGYSLADFRTLLEGVYVGVRHDESRRFAEALQGGLYRQLHGVNARIENRGVKTAPLVVLVGTRMPAILAEVSCISDADEAKRLSTAEYRAALARALASGIRAYAAPSSGDSSVAAERMAASFTKGDS